LPSGLTEHLGIIPREQVANEVKELDQDARGALRKHGVRFGQYTIFLPALLKPAPTRLRLVLWSLAKGFQEFPESPPPGLVTIPNVPGVVDGAYAMSGYRPAGTRAIRIDMLERLADILRGQDSRAGFEAAGRHAVDHRHDTGPVRRPDAGAGLPRDPDRTPEGPAGGGNCPGI
jgi:ATP-dependent RNA helicase SUPV3L1/SUV3